jgi:micrococcal nuclease
MNHLYSLILISFLIVSCSAATQEKPTLLNTYKPIIITPVGRGLTASTNTPTQQPASTPRISETPTPTPTITSSPEVESPFTNLADCLPRNTLLQKGIVTEIIDGDTIIVRLEDGDIYNLRYIGIDAPEREMQFFPETYNANAEMVDQKEVILIKDVSETDPFDRLLRYVIVGDVFVNLHLLETGFARAMQYPPDITCADAFLRAEQTAQASQLGIWVATPTPGPSDAQVIILTVNKRQEYVDIQNVGTFDVDLVGWTLVSERGGQECALSSMIGVGETLRIWAGNAQGGGYSCGYDSPIWNNSEVDPAVLYNARGEEVSRK